MNLATPDGRHKLFQQVHQLLESINALEPDQPDRQPSTPLVGAMLETMTNPRLIALLRAVKEDPLLLNRSSTLSRRSALFDKLIIMKGTGERDWVLRLHTYNLVSSPRSAQEKLAMANGVAQKGARKSNLGDDLQDDEENTHLHRWRLSSRFVTGGFNNVTWRDSPAQTTDPGQRLTKYRIPATAKATGDGARAAVDVGSSWISMRRSELYQAGDIVTYPILNPHSVNSGLAALTGTTMTLAHTGQGIISDSFFFAAKDVPAVAQLPFRDEELQAALTLAITRLQLIDLNNALRASDRRFAPLNSFETELLPRLAELVALRISGNTENIGVLAQRVDLPITQLTQIIDMDTRALAKLIADSQDALYNQDFAKDERDLRRRFPPPPLADQALRNRAQRVPKNVIGPRVR